MVGDAGRGGRLRRTMVVFLASLLVWGGAGLAPFAARVALANTLTVTSAVDSCASPAGGTLRRAIADAVAGDTIQFNLPPGAVITLDGCQLEIDKAITINGPGVAQLAVRGSLDAGESSRVFEIAAPGVALRGMTIANGRIGRAGSSGAGIRVFFNGAGAPIVLEDLVVEDNQVVSAANGAGLSILINEVRMTNVVVRNNAIAATTSPTLTGGGGLFIGDERGATSVTMVNCIVQGNMVPRVDQRGGGIYLRDSAATGGVPSLSLVNSTIGGNEATNGGGIFSAGGSLTLSGTTVAANVASNDGGGLLATGGTATVTVESSILRDNIAGSAGGGMRLEGGAGGTATASLSQVAVSGNQTGTDSGGGIDANPDSGPVSLFVASSTISGNSSGEAGGGLVLGGQSTIENTTISGNRARLSGGGIFYVGFRPLGGVSLRFTTITGNLADSDGDGLGTGGGLFDANDLSSEFGNITVASSIVVGNQVVAPAADDCGGNVISGGANVLGTGTGCPGNGANDRTAATVSPVLNPTLANNGGTTMTHALVAGSPALDLGAVALCATMALSLDQRAIDRPQGGGCDAGAYEARFFTLTTRAAGGGTGNVSPGSGPQIEGSIVPVGAVPTGGSTFAGWTLDGAPVSGPNPLPVTMNAPHTIVANFAAPAPTPSPAPTPAPTVILTLTTAGTGGGNATPPGSTNHPVGSSVALTAAPATGSAFAGWTLDGVLVSWATSVTLTMDRAHTVVATFRPLPSFGDVPPGQLHSDPIQQLAARGIINGCDASAAPPLFCPAGPTLRHQLAALIVRAMPGWIDETGLPTFTDNTDDAELMTRVATLQRHNVVRGYQDEVCRDQGKAPPCYGPLDTVKYGQALLFVARAMVEKGYWTLQPDDRAIFPDQNGAAGADPNTDQQTRDHRMVVTYVRYVGAPPDVADIHAPFLRGGVAAGGWADDSSRAWFARALWAALDQHFGQDQLP